eukprot:TRINITY_DN98_c0_g1_i2.p1 TRINITY_DN98_c0_g1~~TRINITY_DN98_c0_g1_i2.p1  ORF type:complete len:494 (+),score=93.13 TRINITY_DN98_c0_g1_i2:111-1592(+)
MKVQKLPVQQRRRILLTNGRFPVALDLARQLKKVGHTVYSVDPMHYHVHKFSRSVKKSYQVPAPHVAADGYVDCIRMAVHQLRIDILIPLHEEIFYLAQVDDLRPFLFAPDFHTLLALHNKWSFYQLTVAAGLSAPPSVLCKSMEDIYTKLDLANKEYALKPVFGRALSGIHHHKPGEIVPADLGISEDLPYICQEWIQGKQLCSYAVARGGEIKASAVYPVIDTIDGSSCVYFESIESPRVKQFMEVIARTYNITGQIAFDFIETPEHMYVLECNPRATSGIHLYNQTPYLAEAFTNPLTLRVDAAIGKKVQMVPGMLMWDKGEKTRHEKMQHTKRLLGTHDSLFTIRDPFPALMQPFLYVTYKRRCRENNLVLKELFQWDVVWEPTRAGLQKAHNEAIFANDSVAFIAYGENSALTNSCIPNPILVQQQQQPMMMMMPQQQPVTMMPQQQMIDMNRPQPINTFVSDQPSTIFSGDKSNFPQTTHVIAQQAF